MTPGRLLQRHAAWVDRHAAWARVRGVERATGRRLAAADRKRARAYAHEVLGDGGHTPDLCALAVLAGEWRDGWFTQRYLAQVVAPQVSVGVHHVALVKSLTVPLLGSDGSPDVLRLVHGRYLDPGGRPLTIPEATALLREGVASSTALMTAPDAPGGAPGSDVVLKPDGGFRTIGVRFASARDVDLGAWAATARHGVVQRRILPHPSLLALDPHAAVPFRITTVRELDGRITARAASANFFPFRRGPDGWRLESAASFRPIDVAQGRFTATLHTPDGVVHRRHPVTGAPIERARVPGFPAAVALVRALHARVPHVGVVGWDLMIDAQARPWVLEWNTRAPAISYIEPLLGPCFTGLGWERLRATP